MQGIYLISNDFHKSCLFMKGKESDPKEDYEMRFKAFDKKKKKKVFGKILKRRP